MKIPAPEPGVYRSVPHADYRAWDAISWTKDLKPLASKSPAEAHEEALANDGSVSDGMLEGLALHTLVLEGKEEFARGYGVGPDTRRGNAWKEHLEFCEKEGLVPLTSGQARGARELASALLNDEHLGPLFEPSLGDAEVSVVVKIEGLTYKGRLDKVIQTSRGDVVIDLKGTDGQGNDSGVEPAAFARTTGNFLYHVQLAHYADLWQRATGRTVAEMILVPISRSTRAIAGYEISQRRTPELFNMARAELAALRDAHAIFTRANIWPSTASLGVRLAAVPGWYRAVSPDDFTPYLEQI